MSKLLALISMWLLGAGAYAQRHDGKQLVTASLIADADAIVQSQKFTAGLVLKMEPGWHTYWQYSGDSGMATKLDWKLPPGFRAGEIQWPLPEKVTEPGELETYAYKDEVMLLVEITPPLKISGQIVTLRARAQWLVCEKICIPGSAELELTLPVSPVNKPVHEDLFTKYRAELPQMRAPFSTKWSREKNMLTLELSDVPAGTAADFFPIPESNTTVEHPHTKGNTISIGVNADSAAKSLPGVVVLTDANHQRTGYALGISSPLAPSSLLHWLTLGFIGGVILNVMPCVLPVIALKIFGFIKQANESPRKILRLGLAFVAGIFAWFLLLAVLVVAFRIFGRQLNWAFQFQHPAFLSAMIVILLIFALNLLGLFEIVLPGRTHARIVDLSAREGYSGAFLHGVFATLMATPCTAPFLGPALGFALAQNAPTVFAMFASIAAGMSAPYLVLAARPGWLRFLPKPGIWMVRVKQAMGLLLLGSVVWLGWVLWQQKTHVIPPFGPVLETALAKGQPVFVDFTADWCVNCKVNERLVLNTDVVQRAFREHEVIFLKADWTNGDADITKLLKKFGRAGVPAYVLYVPGREPQVLPEILKTQTVLDALAKLPPR